MLRHEPGARFYNVGQLTFDCVIPLVSVAMLDDVSVVGHSRYPGLIGKVKNGRALLYHSLRRAG
jgi:hypothetical protein